MARSRNIKPGFFRNDLLAECSPWARLCFIGLWTMADRAGRLEDRPRRIKGELFAFDSIEVGPLLDELQRHGFILRYVDAQGRALIQIVNFLRHQQPHHREPESELPPPSTAESPGLAADASGAKPGAGPALNGHEAPGLTGIDTACIGPEAQGSVAMEGASAPGLPGACPGLIGQGSALIGHAARESPGSGAMEGGVSRSDSGFLIPDSPSGESARGGARPRAQGPPQAAGNGSQRSPPAAAPRAQRATRIPPDWTPGPDGEAYARRKGLSADEIAAEAEAFRDWHTAAPDAKAKKADFGAAWKLWVHRAISGGPRNGGGPRQGDVFDDAL